VWTYPGALFMSAGGYHHHLGTNVWSHGPSAQHDEARLLEWELVVPSIDDAREAARNLADDGNVPRNDDGGFVTADPWGTRVRLRPPDK